MAVTDVGTSCKCKLYLVKKQSQTGDAEMCMPKESDDDDDDDSSGSFRCAGPTRLHSRGGDSLPSYVFARRLASLVAPSPRLVVYVTTRTLPPSIFPLLSPDLLDLRA
ncbi:hypothetical protein BHM03_00039842 [Ensete ventricosum]|nr:hypothetical protein BHM03_00039842 [Ensete ventricosum]